VQFLAETRDGYSTSAPDDNPFVVIPERDPSMPLHSQDHLIRGHLANQRCVIMKAELDGPQSFTKEDIGAVKGPLNQPVHWHGELKR
jgi:hypothetical protein